MIKTRITKGEKMLYFSVSRNLQNFVGSMSICLDSKKVKKILSFTIAYIIVFS